MKKEKTDAGIAESVRETKEIMSDPDLMRQIEMSRMEARAGMTVPWEDVREEMVTAARGDGKGGPDAGFGGWRDMPEPKTVLALSWEDIAYRARDRGKSLTRDQVMDIFGRIDASEPMMDDFWELIDSHTDDAVRAGA